MREHDVSEENSHAVATNRWRVRQLPISQESASVVGHKHVRNKKGAGAGEKTKPVAIGRNDNITLMNILSETFPPH